jgi:hypothetical protein
MNLYLKVSIPTKSSKIYFLQKYSGAYKWKENHRIAETAWFRAFLYGGHKGKVVFRQKS